MEKILLQQTDPAVLEVATLTLEENYRVIAVNECPNNFNHLFKSGKPDIIILDYILDGKDAIQSLYKIKRISAKIPVLVLSCNNNIETQAKAHGFDGYMKKPFDLNELLELLDDTIKRLNQLKVLERH